MFPKTLFLLIPTLLLILTSCESHEQKSDEAFNEYKQEKNNVRDTIIVISKAAPEIIKKEPNKTQYKIVKIEEHLQYKKELESKVSHNDSIIRILKKTHELNPKVYKKIIHLEEINNTLLKQIDDYNEEIKLSWKKLEEDINKEMHELEVDLNNYK